MLSTRTELARASLDPGVADVKIMAAWEAIKGDEKAPVKNERRFLSNKEARQFLGDVSRTSLWRLVKKGLSVYQLGGRQLFKADDLEKFVLKQNRNDLSRNADDCSRKA